jgi:hypothetical protein
MLLFLYQLLTSTFIEHHIYNNNKFNKKRNVIVSKMRELSLLN